MLNGRLDCQAGGSGAGWVPRGGCHLPVGCHGVHAQPAVMDSGQSQSSGETPLPSPLKYQNRPCFTTQEVLSLIFSRICNSVEGGCAGGAELYSADYREGVANRVGAFCTRGILDNQEAAILSDQDKKIEWHQGFTDHKSGVGKYNGAVRLTSPVTTIKSCMLEWQ